MNLEFDCGSRGPDLLQTIEVQSLSKKVGEVYLLNSVSFTVSAGSLLIVLGTNGAGKTTLSRILSTTLRPTSGDVRINGVSCSDQPEKVRAFVGLMTEMPSLHDALTVRQELEFTARCRGGADSTNLVVDEMLQKLQLEEYGATRTGRLSKGTKYRVAFGRALLCLPPVLILDEPTGTFDPVFTQLVESLIDEVVTAGVAVLLATHSLDQALRLGGTTIVLSRGRVSLEGATNDLLRDPAMVLSALNG